MNLDENDRKLADLEADGTIGPDVVHTVKRFAQFLRNAGPPTCTCELASWDIATRTVIPHVHLAPDTYAYAHGADVDPEGM